MSITPSSPTTPAARATSSRRSGCRARRIPISDGARRRSWDTGSASPWERSWWRRTSSASTSGATPPSASPAWISRPRPEPHPDPVGAVQQLVDGVRAAHHADLDREIPRHRHLGRLCRLRARHGGIWRARDRAPATSSLPSSAASSRRATAPPRSSSSSRGRKPACRVTRRRLEQRYFAAATRDAASLMRPRSAYSATSILPSRKPRSRCTSMFRCSASRSGTPLGSR